MESMVIGHPSQEELRAAYGGARVFVTGHTGFKGSWLTLWLRKLGARVTGYALPPETEPSMFHALSVGSDCTSHFADVCDLERLAAAIDAADPEFVFHLAAQPLVRRSYEQPLETIQTNVLGTANLLDVLRRRGRPCTAVVVTSDKAYENREWVFGYRETDSMGGHDVYSMSKGAAELVVASYRRSYFGDHRTIRLASARAGNVVGGGDWAADRIVPDLVRAIARGEELLVRRPDAVRPWQHVLEPLGGYLLLGARMASGDDLPLLCDAWNFGPQAGNTATVAELLEQIIAEWGRGGWRSEPSGAALHEANMLRLSIDKAVAHLKWSPRWDFAATCARTVEWYRAFHERRDELYALTLRQIDDYMNPAAQPAAILENA